MISHASPKVKDNLKRKENQVLTNSSTFTVSMDLLHRGKNFCSKPFTRSRAERRPPLAWHWFNYLHRVNEYQTLLLNSHRVHSPTLIWTLNPSPDCYEVQNSKQASRKDPTESRASPGPWQSSGGKAGQSNPSNTIPTATWKQKETFCNVTRDFISRKQGTGTKPHS